MSNSPAGSNFNVGFFTLARGNLTGINGYSIACDLSIPVKFGRRFVLKLPINYQTLMIEGVVFLHKSMEE